MASVNLKPSNFHNKEDYLKATRFIAELEASALSSGSSNNGAVTCLFSKGRYNFFLNGSHVSRLHAAQFLIS